MLTHIFTFLPQLVFLVLFDPLDHGRMAIMGYQWVYNFYYNNETAPFPLNLQAALLANVTLLAGRRAAECTTPCEQ